MLGSTSRGCVSISIDAGQLRVPALADWLHARLEDVEMSATWVLASPASTPIATRIYAEKSRHEISLLVDASQFLKSARPRFDFMQCVIRPLRITAEAGRPISTLSISHAWRPQHLDLITKCGVTIVHSPRLSAASHESSGVQTVCYGLHHVGIDTTISGGGWMAERAQLKSALAAVNSATLPGGFCHVRIDLSSMASGSSSVDLQAVDRLLDHLEHLRTEGRVEIETLRQIGARLVCKRNSAPARSILRAA